METRVFRSTLRSQAAFFGALLVMFVPVVLPAVSGMRNHPGDGARAYAVFAGLFAALAGILSLLNIIFPMKLELTDQGMTWRGWNSRGFYAWEDLDRVFVKAGRFGPGSRIGIEFATGKGPDNAITKDYNRKAWGYDRAMTNVWPPRSEDLAALMNAYIADSREPIPPPQTGEMARTGPPLL